MLPVLQARRSIATINEMALGFGSMEKAKADQYVFNLNTAASKPQAGTKDHYNASVKVGSAQELAAAIPGLEVVFEPGPKTKAKMRAEAESSTQEFADR
jgi:hypothetical protein